MAYDIETAIDSIDHVDVTKPKLAELKGRREAVSLFMRYLPDGCEEPTEVSLHRLLDKYDHLKPVVSEGSIVTTPTGYRIVHDFKDERMGLVSHVADLVAIAGGEYTVRTQSGIPRTSPSTPVRFEGTLAKTLEGFAGLVDFHFKGMSAWVLVELVYD